jgi:hypothetical protein
VARTRLAVLGTILVIAAVLIPAVSRGPAPAAAFMQGDVITLNFRGTGERQPSASDRFVWVSEMYSMTTLQKIGKATHDIAFTGPGMADHVMTFHFPDGDLVSHDQGTFAPDVGRPGFFHVGVHPQGNTILPDKSTGAYKGRTGRLRMSGWHDTTEAPQRVTFDDFYWIELDPKR